LKIKLPNKEMSYENPCDIIEIIIAETEFTVRVKICPHCNETHAHKVPIELLSNEKGTVNLACTNVKRLPRLTRFSFDLRKNSIESENDKQPLKNHLILQHGEESIDDKYLRWEEVNRASMWVIDEFNQFLDEISQAYVQGYYYLSITGACCLTERILNRLVLKLKKHYKTSPKYKLFHNREQQIQNWNLLIETLADWSVLNDEQIQICKELHRYRNESVHYIPNYNFQEVAPTVIKLATRFIDSLFSVLERNDIYNIFTIPGEIWVKEEKMNDPFVQEFVLSCCSMGGAISQFEYEKNEYLEDGAIVGDLSEKEFIRVRTDYGKSPNKYLKKKTPILCRFLYKEQEKFIRLI
jgi:hypothetical protein